MCQGGAECCPGPGRGQGEQAIPRPVPAGPVPLAPAPPARLRRQQVQHGQDRRGARAAGHPCVHAAPRAERAPRSLPQTGIRLQRCRRRMYLPERHPPRAPPSGQHRADRAVPSAGGGKAQCTAGQTGGRSGASSTRTTSTACVATSGAHRTTRRCASAGSGSSRSSPKPRIGMGYDDSACADWRRSTGRGYYRRRAEPQAAAQPPQLGPPPVDDRRVEAAHQSSSRSQPHSIVSLLTLTRAPSWAMRTQPAYFSTG